MVDRNYVTSSYFEFRSGAIQVEWVPCNMSRMISESSVLNCTNLKMKSLYLHRHRIPIVQLGVHWSLSIVFYYFYLINYAYQLCWEWAINNDIDSVVWFSFSVQVIYFFFHFLRKYESDYLYLYGNISAFTIL